MLVSDISLKNRRIWCDQIASMGILLFGLAVFVACSAAARRADLLQEQLRPFTDLFYAEPGTALEMDIAWGKGDNERVSLGVMIADDKEWLMNLSHPDYELELWHRQDGQAVMRLPLKKIRFTGQGEGDQKHSLAPAGLLLRLISRTSELYPYARFGLNTDPNVLNRMFAALAEADYQGDGKWRLHALGDVSVQFVDRNDGKPEVHVVYREQQAEVRIVDPQSFAGSIDLLQSAEEEEVEVDQAELERVVVRSARRVTEVLMPGWALRNPLQSQRKVDNGRLDWIEGQRVVHLWGDPENIGKAHGHLLAGEIRYCVDSTIYLVGLAETVRSGMWFPQKLRDILAQVKPYIPERHLRELDAMAEAAGISRQEARMANVFPEFFHCSGFAVFDTATADGALYHGRVLDYMTEIGLHHSNTVFFIEPDDHYSFVNVGYAGFVGSVTGMNEKQLSLGEMGGSQRGYWDGVPMSILMRRAMEESATLTEVEQLWRESPRTCEFFYVFADGKIPSAKGVAATWEDVEFFAPGTTHELLGEGIEDALLLSSGSRLQTLRERVQEGHGSFTVESALSLMDRPVAMRSNLHNVLFLPQALQLYVSHADDKAIAAEREYVKLDARDWWGSHQQAD